MKKCTKCASEGPFYNSKSMPDGLDYYCKKCRNVITRAYNSKPTSKLRHKLEERLARLEGRRSPKYFPGLSPEIKATLVEKLRPRIEEVKVQLAREAKER